MIVWGQLTGFDWDAGNSRKSVEKHGVGQSRPVKGVDQWPSNAAHQCGRVHIARVIGGQYIGRHVGQVFASAQLYTEQRAHDGFVQKVKNESDGLLHGGTRFDPALVLVAQHGVRIMNGLARVGSRLRGRTDSGLQQVVYRFGVLHHVIAELEAGLRFDGGG